MLILSGFMTKYIKFYQLVLMLTLIRKVTTFFRPHRVRVPPARESLAPYFTANAEIGIALLTE